MMTLCSQDNAHVSTITYHITNATNWEGGKHISALKIVNCTPAGFQ